MREGVVRLAARPTPYKAYTLKFCIDLGQLSLITMAMEWIFEALGDNPNINDKSAC